MSNSTELRRIFGAMTERPWHVSDTQPEYVSSADHLVFDTYGNVNDAPNAAGLCALANHADVLVALVEAVEKVVASGSYGRLEDRMLQSALAAVHAIPVKP